MDTNSLTELLQDIFSSSDIQIGDSTDIDRIVDLLDNYGIDISSYSADDINQALEYAINDDVDSNLESSNSQNNISFGSNQDSLERDLRQANSDINYYEKELRRTNISDTYRNNCLFKLQQAVKKAAELTEKIGNLKK